MEFLLGLLKMVPWEVVITLLLDFLIGKSSLQSNGVLELGQNGIKKLFGMS